MPELQEREGWGFPGAARKAHYFRGAISICRRWFYGGRLEPETGKRSPNDCVQCRRLLDKDEAAAKRQRAPVDADEV
jgi:hypothetical protein